MMKIDQLAWYCHTPAQADAVKKWFGLTDKKWVHDTAMGVMNSTASQKEVTTHLSFNYDLGIEFEILRFEDPEDHWSPRAVEDGPFMSHVGIHVDEFPLTLRQKPVAEMFTRRHTNTYLLRKKRTYHYKIYSNNFIFGQGTFLKYIKRSHNGAE